jgi:hypothetical protein
VNQDLGPVAIAAATHMHRACPTLVNTGNCKLETCAENAVWMGRAWLLVDAIQPALLTHVVLPTRKDEDQRMAMRIRAELVCCDITERMDAEAPKGRWDDENHVYLMPQSWSDLRKSHDFHPICYFGGWAANIAAAGAGRRYWCSSGGEMELNEGGGFQTCCDNPEGHIVMGPETDD